MPVRINRIAKDNKVKSSSKHIRLSGDKDLMESAHTKAVKKIVKNTFNPSQKEGDLSPSPLFAAKASSLDRFKIVSLSTRMKEEDLKGDRIVDIAVSKAILKIVVDLILLLKEDKVYTGFTPLEIDGPKASKETDLLQRT